MGADVYEMIDLFGREGKLFKVHFEWDEPLPSFRETLWMMDMSICIK